MYHPQTMPPEDLDTMIHDMSNQMARSQLFRRLSGRSSNTSPSNMRGTARITKSHSSGNTPHGVQRRRTTAAPRANNTTSRNPACAMPQMEERNFETKGLLHSTRPMTWHPGSYVIDGGSGRLPNYDFLPQPFHEPQASAVTYTSVPPSLPRDQSMIMDREQQQTTMAMQPGLLSAEYSLFQDELQNSFYPESCNLPDQHQTLYALNTGPSNTYHSMDYQTPETCLVPPVYAEYSTQQTPKVLPIQDPPRQAQYIHNPVKPTSRISTQQSKELIGMGLYDGPDRKELSNSAANQLGLLWSEPQGKGLKLEETWQPPNKDAEEDDDDEEAYSTDEAEEDLPPAPPAKEIQPPFIPAYCDLSNQSFFFDNDDLYSNCMSFNQGLQDCQPKAAELSSQNFMWL